MPFNRLFGEPCLHQNDTQFQADNSVSQASKEIQENIQCSIKGCLHWLRYGLLP